MVEGIRWLIAHPPMRTLALTILTFNVTYGAAWSVLVLYAGERLGMNEVGFGLLTTAVAVGGVVGIVVVRPAGAALLAGRHHAGRPAHRDRHAPVARADDLAARRAGARWSSSGRTRSSGARPRRSSASAPSRTSCSAG